MGPNGQGRLSTTRSESVSTVGPYGSSHVASGVRYTARLERASQRAAEAAGAGVSSASRGMRQGRMACGETRRGERQTGDGVRQAERKANNVGCWLRYVAKGAGRTQRTGSCLLLSRQRCQRPASPCRPVPPTPHPPRSQQARGQRASLCLTRTSTFKTNTALAPRASTEYEERFVVFF